jgi:hypothetical protein
MWVCPIDKSEFSDYMKFYRHMRTFHPQFDLRRNKKLRKLLTKDKNLKKTLAVELGLWQKPIEVCHNYEMLIRKHHWLPNVHVIEINVDKNKSRAVFREIVKKLGKKLRRVR